eukprot:1547229-Rhodomonas_salina.1
MLTSGICDCAASLAPVSDAPDSRGLRVRLTVTQADRSLNLKSRTSTVTGPRARDGVPRPCEMRTGAVVRRQNSYTLKSNTRNRISGT